jgi:hypothetical protein
LHNTTDSLTYSAPTDVLPNRQRRYPRDADTTLKPEPDTVTDVLASDTAADGHTDDTDADAMYVYCTPLELNCCPFRDTSNARAPTPADTPAEHSTRPADM